MVEANAAPTKPSSGMPKFPKINTQFRVVLSSNELIMIQRNTVVLSRADK